jgi:hypothetical protein
MNDLEKQDVISTAMFQNCMNMLVQINFALVVKDKFDNPEDAKNFIEEVVQVWAKNEQTKNSIDECAVQELTIHLRREFKNIMDKLYE